MRKMPKEVDEGRFQNAAVLFRFCQSVLEYRRRISGGEKVYDQDVGNLLNFNPSDTSHWKKGKKALRSIYALEILAYKLDIDHAVVCDVSQGIIGYDEAWSDFLDTEEVRSSCASLLPEERVSYKSHILELESYAKDLLEAAQAVVNPVYLPELSSHMPYVQIVQGQTTDRLARSSRTGVGQFTIRYQKGNTNAYTRAAVARELARVMLLSKRELGEMPQAPDNRAIKTLEVYDLAACLLIPKDLFTAELRSASSRANLVSVLAEAFWVPASMVRARFNHRFLHLSADTVVTAEPPVVQLMGGQRSPVASPDGAFSDEPVPFRVPRGRKKTLVAEA